MLALKGYEQNEGFSVMSTDEFHKARNIWKQNVCQNLKLKNTYSLE